MLCDEEAARLTRLRRNLRCGTARLTPCARRAAVSCLLRVGPSGCLQAFYITRAAHPGDPWSGDVAWPGGRVEPGETDLEAAVREVREEVGLDLLADGGSAWELLGPLDDRPAVRRGGVATLVVRAFVFFQRCLVTPPLTLHEREVSAGWWLPLSLLSDPPRPLPFFDVPVARLATRIPALRSRRVLACVQFLGLDVALFPYINLPPPPGAPGPTRLWGVTLGLAELLLHAADGAHAALAVPRWRLRHIGWDMVLWVAAMYAPDRWGRT